MIVVVGSPTVAGAHAKVPYTYAHDDPAYLYTKNSPHPVNLQYSFGKQLANIVKAPFLVGHVCKSNSDVLAEIARIKQEFAGKNLFFIAETFTPASQSTVASAAGKIFTGIAIGVKYNTLVPSFASVAAGHESFTSDTDFDDAGHRLFTKVLLNYIIEHHKEHFGL